MKFLHTQVEKFFQGGWGLRTIGLGWKEGMGQKTPSAPLMGAQTFLGGSKYPNLSV